MKAVQLKNLTVRLGGNLILDNLNFSIDRGSITAVIGPNGSGKTTLFKAILGLLPYQGTVRIFNKTVREVLPRIGYVPQRFEMDKEFPINCEEFLHIYNFQKNKEKIRQVLELVGMGKKSQQLIGRLSGGELQRLLIAAALLTDPQILFLDEALSGIDIEGAKDFYHLILALNKEKNLTLVMISHEIDMVYKFADNVICLNKNLVCTGKTKEAITKEVLEKLYGQEVHFTKHEH